VSAAAVAVVAFSGYLLSSWPPEPPPPSVEALPANSAASAPDADVDEQKQVLAVLGDSVSAESKVSTGPEWPELVAQSLEWKVVTDTVDGSGYVNPGEGKPFGERVPAVLRQTPDVIVVAGGVSDLVGYPVPQVVKAAEDVIADLVREAPDAQVVLVSPFSVGEPGPMTKQLSSKLRRIADEQGVEYVDATGWLASGYNLFAGDGVHPTDEGQKRLAERMEQELAALETTDEQP
jgi:acyl-CoA thioesterase-1